MRTSQNGVKGINTSGDVVGTLDTPEHHPAAFLFRKGKLMLLGTLGGQESWASAINDRGQIVGAAQRADGTTLPFVWERGKMRAILPAPTLWGMAVASDANTLTGLNNKGQVVGCAFGLDGVIAPFQRQLGQKAALQEASNSRLDFIPTGLNDRGQIIGCAPGGRAFPGVTAVLWDGHNRFNLGTLIMGGISRPNAINNRGQVVGAASTNGIYQDHAFFWDGSAIHDLGTAGGSTSAANAINNNGQIVGEADMHYEEHSANNSVQWGGSRAILWKNGKAYLLQDLLPKDAGWVLESAAEINDRGQIVGLGYHSNDRGKSRIGGICAFLLTPYPEGH